MVRMKSEWNTAYTKKANTMIKFMSLWNEIFWKGEMKMNKQDMEKYKIASDVTTSECYMGTKDCGSCMHAFPGSYSLDLISTDCDGSEKNICMMCKK